MQSGPGSITRWLEALAEAESEAQVQIFNRYFERLVALARSKMAGLNDRAVDDEDVAIQAMTALFRGVEKRQFPSLRDREDLRQILFVLVANRVKDLHRREQAAKRNIVNVHRATDLDANRAESAPGVLDTPSDDPTPEESQVFVEEVRRRFTGLTDEQRMIALMRFEGYTNEEIARSLGCALATVERRLKSIRANWTEQP